MEQSFGALVNVELFNIFGINPSIVSIIIAMILVLIIWVSALIWTGSSIIAIIVSIGSLIPLGVLGFIPIWIAVMYGVFAIGYVLMWGGSGVPANATEDYWVQYGDRIKLAYSAKFGGENLAFSDEVNKRVNVMLHNRNGFTKTISRDWLKRMNNFTESK